MDSNPNIFESYVDPAFAGDRASFARERVIEFYEETASDYETWSRDFNMHLGFYRRVSDVFDRRKMFEQMSLEIAGRLDLHSSDTQFLIDLGCGFGAITRTIARIFSNTVVKGVTLVPSHVEAAKKLNVKAKLQDRIEILEGDYTKLPFRDGAADGVWAVESACYATGADKADLVSEMARVLKKGGRFAVADCFIKRPEKGFNFLLRRSYPAVCKYWILPEMPVLDSFVAALERQGFRDVAVEDISWRVAPSLAHAPFAVASFILKKLLAGEAIKKHSLNNLKASLLALTIGANRSKFSYCLISGKRG